MDKILKAAEGLDALHALILVVNGSDARRNIAVQNTFNRLRNNLPDSVIQNTLAVFTNCNSLTRYSLHAQARLDCLHVLSKLCLYSKITMSAHRGSFCNTSSDQHSLAPCFKSQHGLPKLYNMNHYAMAGVILNLQSNADQP